MRGKLFLALLSASAFAGVMLAGTGVAQADTTNTWNSAAGYGDLWYNSSTGYFYSSDTNYTSLTGNVNTTGEWELPNGDCMTYNYSAGGAIDDHACDGIASEEWTLTDEGGDRWIFVNAYANSEQQCTSDGKSGTNYLGTTGDTAKAYMMCTVGGPLSEEEWQR